MDCREYVENWLSADADGELSADESRAAAEHLAGCAACRARLAEERSLKAAISRVGLLAVPSEEFNARLGRALDAEDRAPHGSRRTAFSARRVWIPLAIAAVAATVVVAVLSRRPVVRVASAPATVPSEASAPSIPTNPAFEWATGRFSVFEKKFAPTVSTSSVESLIEDYSREVDLPPYAWDFRELGFQLIGGRVDRMKDGRPVTYTMYRGPSGDILCARYRVESMPIPPGGRELNRLHHFYSYNGCSVCLTVVGKVCCMLVSRVPVAQFYHYIDKIES